MAKKPEKLTLADLNRSLKSGDLRMNPAVLAQLEAAMATPAAAQVQDLNTKIGVLANTIHENTVALTNGKSKSTQALDLSENQIETEKVEKHQTELLEKIEENTRPDVKSKIVEQKDDNKKSLVPSVAKLGFFSTMLALTLGTLVGAIKSYSKIVWGIIKQFGSIAKSVFTGLTKILPESIKNFGPNLIKRFKTAIDILSINVSYAFGSASEFFRNKFPKTFSTFQKVISGIGTFFSNAFSVGSKAFNLGASGINKVGEIFKIIRTSVQSFLRPFKAAASVIVKSIGFVSNGIQGVSTFFSTLASKFTIFSKLFKLGMFIGAKIPILNLIVGGIAGLFSAIEEFGKSGSIIKSLGAFSKSAVKIVVTDFADLIKDGISWVSKKLGFKNFAKKLDSFSFTKAYNQFVDDMVIIYEKIAYVVTHPVESIKKLFKSIGNWLAGIEIPSIDIPVIGKFGPWKPFAGMGENVATPDANAAAPLAPAAIKPASLPAQSAGIYGKSAENEAKKIAADKKVIQAPTVVTTQQVNNQSQNAFIKTPIRNGDSSINRYLSLAF